MAPVRASSPFLRLMLVAAALTLVSACASEFERRFSEAERLRAEASAAGAEWLQTAKLLEQARDAEAGGDNEAALVLVEEARFQAEAALRQAEHEATAWRARVVR